MTAGGKLPVPTPPSDFDRMVGSIFAFIEDGIPNQALYDLTILSDTAGEFEAGMSAMVELGDIIADHYDTVREPDDGPYDEEDDHLWGTEGDDFDPDDFDPDDD